MKKKKIICQSVYIILGQGRHTIDYVTFIEQIDAYTYNPKVYISFHGSICDLNLRP